jgi:hypothetical protein
MLIKHTGTGVHFSCRAMVSFFNSQNIWPAHESILHLAAFGKKRRKKALQYIGFRSLPVYAVPDPAFYPKWFSGYFYTAFLASVFLTPFITGLLSSGSRSSSLLNADPKHRNSRFFY